VDERRTGVGPLFEVITEARLEWTITDDQTGRQGGGEHTQQHQQWRPPPQVAGTRGLAGDRRVEGHLADLVHVEPSL
jgi:hypothetical protein